MRLSNSIITFHYFCKRIIQVGKKESDCRHTINYNILINYNLDIIFERYDEFSTYSKIHNQAQE